MTAVDVPPERRAPLQRGRGDGIVRLARRSQRGQGRRRILVLALIAVAVALGAGTAIAGATALATDAELQSEAVLGGADLVVSEAWEGWSAADEFAPPELTPAQQQWLDEHRTPADEALIERGPFPDAGPGAPRTALPLEVVLDLLPEGSQVLPVVEHHLPDVRLIDLDVAHPLAGDSLDTDARVGPLAWDEVLAAPSWLEQRGASVGDTVEVPTVGAVEVVGTATLSAARTEPLVVVAPGRLDDVAGSTREVRIGLADGEPDVVADDLRAALIAERAASEVPLEIPGVITATDLRSSGDARLLAMGVIIVTGFAVTVAALVAACAFAVGVRRRLRQLGMLGAVGATPGQVGRLVRAEGLVLGVLGSGLGLAAAFGLALVVVPLVERVLGIDVLLQLPLLTAVPAVFVGALGAMFAAWWPARTAARVPVVAALAGRLPVGRLPGWLPLASAGVTALGIWMFAEAAAMNVGGTGYGGMELPVMVAAVVATLGVAGLGLPVLALGGRVADRLPVVPRLALRDAARRRARSGAAVAALVPVLALPVVGLVVATAKPAGATWVEPEPVSVVVVQGRWVGMLVTPPAVSEVAAVTSGLATDGRRADLVSLGPVDGTGGSWGAWRADGMERVETFGGSASLRLPAAPVALATPQLLDLLGLSHDAVGEGEALVLTRGLAAASPARGQQLFLTDGPHLPMVDDGPVLPDHPPLTAVVRDDVDGLPHGAVLVTPATAERLDLREVGRAVALGLERPPAWDELWDLPVAPDTHVEAQPVPPFTGRWIGRVVLTGAAGLAGLLLVVLVAGMTAALAATESDHDLRRAVAIGAPPSIRRWFHGVQAWWHTAIAAVFGSALGVAVGRIGIDRVWQEPDPRTWPVVIAWALLAPAIVGATVGLSMRESRVEAAGRRQA